LERSAGVQARGEATGADVGELEKGNAVIRAGAEENPFRPFLPALLTAAWKALLYQGGTAREFQNRRVPRKKALMSRFDCAIAFADFLASSSASARAALSSASGFTTRFIRPRASSSSAL